jgi:DNA-binding NtrC family response regulator
MPATVMPLYGREAETGHMPASITDVLTIGEESTVSRPVQRALQPTGWAVAHASGLEAAITWLRSNVAAVVVAEAELDATGLTGIVSSVRCIADAPEIVLVTWNELPLQTAVEAGAFDVVQRPFVDSDLLWAVATAWHNWMTRRERAFGAGPCSDA